MTTGLRSKLPAVLCMLVVAAILVQCARAQQPKDLRPRGYVNDFAGVINPQTQQELTAICTEVDQKARAQIAVVTVKSLEGEPIDNFSIDLATRWGIGPKQKDRGVMILLAPNDRQYRFEVGYGLEPILPDGLVGDFGRQAKPLLRAGNYSGALLLMTERVARVIAKDRGVTLSSLSGQPSGMPENEAETPQGSGPNLFPLLLFAFFLFFPFIGLLTRIFGGRRRYGRSHSAWWWMGPWFWGGMGGGWGGGSWGGGGFGGSGGFGGFGGGSFGGGGASGSW